MYGLSAAYMYMYLLYCPVCITAQVHAQTLLKAYLLISYRRRSENFQISNLLHLFVALP